MEKESQKTVGNMWVRVLLAGISIGILFVVGYFLRGTLISLFLAFIVAYVFNPVINFLERIRWPFTHKHICRELGIAILISTACLVTGGFLTYAVPKTASGIYKVGGIITEQYPKYKTAVEAWIETYEDSEFAKSVKSLLKEHSNQKPSPVQGTETVKNFHLQKKQMAEVAWGFKKYLPQAMGFSLSIVKSVFYSTFGFAGIIINFIIFSIVSVYLLKDFNGIAQNIKTIFPVSKRDYAIYLLTKINDNLRCFLRGQLVICLILSLIYSIGLTIAGVPLSFLIGFIGGFGNLIPYVGTGTGIVLASTLAIFQFHDFKHVLSVLITFGVGQLLEGTVITPRVMGKGLGLSPVMVILSILICSQLLGFLGLLLAVPIASTVKVFVDEFISRYKSSQYYKGES